MRPLLPQTADGPTRWVRTALVALLALDLALIGAFVVHKASGVGPEALHLGTDGGAGEWAQYAKLLVIAGALAWVARAPGRSVFAVLGALALALLLDDVGRLHEQAGVWVASAFEVPPVAGLRAEDLGEVLWLGALTSPFLVAGAAAYRRTPGPDRRVVHVAVAGVAVLAAFGVGVDLLHQGVVGGLAGPVRGLDSAFVLLEEGGEMVVMSLLAAGAVGLARATDPAPVGEAQPGARRASDRDPARAARCAPLDRPTVSTVT